MVEGIIVMSVMLGFLGLIVFIDKAYSVKLDLQQNTRANVLYTASHGCSGGGGQVPLGSLPAGASQQPADGAGSLSTSWNVADMSNSASVSWSYVANQNGPNGNIAWGHTPAQTDISAKSYCVCNEKKYNSQLTAWFLFAKDMFTSLGGLGALGKLF